MAKLLTEAGYPCEPEDVWCQQGEQRIHGTESRWGAWVKPEGSRFPTNAASWDTMTECARNGILVWCDGRFHELTISAKEPAPVAVTLAHGL